MMNVQNLCYKALSLCVVAMVRPPSCPCQRQRQTKTKNAKCGLCIVCSKLRNSVISVFVYLWFS